MEEMKDIFKGLFAKVDSRREALLEMSKHSENEVAKAIYMLSSELCEFQKLMLMLLAKR